jgi:hypothetical protein
LPSLAVRVPIVMVMTILRRPRLMNRSPSIPRQLGRR